ncbi:C2H2 transcription factor [Thermothelomyces thermophilus ATCC 42464]|uniref:C2H2 transcription factor n=1 Tax=Thermothelomyces thermophilus (strain ATCC 42464 / BCRC 31852 / DSM 1799) TaxID=573729 RepID=G2Q4S8_THET4|nr:C2H2 transcription factor [Thermothelomyces thermophilus ATCC 42464]AEO55367.1 C2H2 transcription factor [Thermothelomyces thermophilus ATCC 42464]
MDEFVNWDQADPAPATGVDMLSPSLEPTSQRLDDIDLALANVQGDEFSFWALQHFENNISPTLGGTEEIPMPTDRSTRTFEDHLELFNDMKCNNCQLGGYECKRIPEGQYKGYCTSCVALRCACNFGLDCADGTDCFLPPNPWPVMGDHPRMLQEERQAESHESSSATDLPGLTSTSGADSTSANEGPKGKTGARFSRESVKILKNWLSTHSKHPYPNDEEKEMLQRQTGLSKTQITNWLANTRRRNKNAVSHRSTSPGVRSWANPIDIPQRRRNPFEHMNPLQRWEHSPPENEPASVTAIARAVNSASSMSSGLHSPFSVNFTDDGSGRSLCGSAISSANTSHSQSSASAYSFGSRGSFGSGSSIPRGRRRRRRRAPVTAAHGGPPKTYQCTFCPDTFRTKHDWQRHEKSLHLSLERWVCCPNGPQAFNPENGQMSCVFCGHPNPDEAHIESHNHSACQERTIGERTFYRKDHLRQHLKLVHSAKFMSWSMEQWKATTPEIRSRCGFCGTVMDTWSIRVDHLAEHFKKGKSMADWKGGWGFDPPVMNMVENSIPPYLIHDERNSPNPFRASEPTASSARHAFELIKSELSNYADDWREREGCDPPDENLQRTACTLIYDAEELAEPTANSTASWLRDLLFSDDRLAQEARWTKVRGIEFWQQLKINGKANIFELDPMESELQEYVKARRLLGLTAMDSELQVEACKIIQRMSADSYHQPSSDHITDFLIRLVKGSTQWLVGFRQRAHLPRSEDVADEGKRSKDPTTIDSTIHNPNRLEYELGEFVRAQRAVGIEPTDEDLQRQARLIIYEYDDPWNQTAADDPVWLATFKQRHGRAAIPSDGSLSNAQPPTASASDSWPSSHDRSSSQGHAMLLPSSESDASNRVPQKTRGTLYINDANCYLRLARELKKWVTATMSPNNPNRHVPSDEELQHQARWIIYEDDDPWNQTAADNFEWLRRFKRDVGLLTDPSLPGLPSTRAWNIAQGGSGFSPPYLFPNPAKASEITAIPTPDEGVHGTDPLPPNTSAAAAVTTSSTALENSSAVINITMCEGGKPIPAPSSTANRFMRGLVDTRRHGPLAAVFCSRELERELSEFVTNAVMAAGFGGAGTGKRGSPTAGFPSDEAIRERARAFLGGVGRTPADDEVLLERFKEVMRKKLGLEPESAAGEAQQAREQVQQEKGQQANPLGANLGFEAPGVAGPPASTETELSPGTVDAEVGNMLAQMDFDFGDLGDFVGVATGGMPMDQY